MSGSDQVRNMKAEPGGPAQRNAEAQGGAQRPERRTSDMAGVVAGAVLRSARLSAGLSETLSLRHAASKRTTSGTGRTDRTP